jgi:NADH:ubiquinone oxidoreductase subunit H
MEPIANFPAFIVTLVIVLVSAFATFAVLPVSPLSETHQIAIAVLVSVAARVVAFKQSIYIPLGNAVMRLFARR